MGGGLTGCTTAGIQIIIIVLFTFTVSKLELLVADPSYCWLYPSKQAIDNFMLFAHLYRVLFSHLKHSVEQVLAVDPSAHIVDAGRLLITTSMNNLKSPTNATMTAVGGARD